MLKKTEDAYTCPCVLDSTASSCSNLKFENLELKGVSHENQEESKVVSIERPSFKDLSNCISLNILC